VQDPERVIIGDHAEHTRSQAIWFHRLHLQHSFESATIYASPYHVVRAYLTFLKYLLDQDCKLPVFARPTPISPATVVPESGMSSWDLIHGEAQRVQVYQERGHVMSVEKLRDYLAWLWSLDILPHY
jgi:uncharacterized SAM-binding protein YcdF (DUF218 family)